MGEEQIKIGLLFSLTGTTSLAEQGQYQSAQLAINQINLAGGIDGIPLSPIVEDIASDPLTARSKAVKLIEEDGVAVLVGTYTSACRKAVLPVLEQYDRLLLYPVLYEGNEQNKWVFYCGPAPNQHLRHFIPWITENLGSSFYLIGSDYIYPQETHKHVKKLLEASGGYCVGESYIQLGAKDFRSVLDEIDKAQPKVVYSTLVGDSILAFYKQYREMGMTIPLCSPITSEKDLHELDCGYGPHWYSSFPYFMSVRSRTNDSFINAHRAAFGTEVVNWAMEHTYNSIYLLAEALKTCKGKVQTHSLRKALCQSQFDAPQGHIHFEAGNQHLWQYSRIAKVSEEGRFDILWESEMPIEPRPFLFGEEAKPAVRQTRERKPIYDHRLLPAEEVTRRKAKWRDYSVWRDMAKTLSYPCYLFDEEGILLEAIVPDGDNEVGIRMEPGSDWSPEAKGRNGFGKSLATQRTQIVSGDQHDYPLLKSYSTVGIPIMNGDHCLGVWGMLDKRDGDAKAMNRAIAAVSLNLKLLLKYLDEEFKCETFRDALRRATNRHADSFFIVKDKSIVFANESAEFLMRSRLPEIKSIIDDLSVMVENPVEKFLRRKIGDNLLEITLTEHGKYRYIRIHVTPSGERSRGEKNACISFQDIIGMDASFLQTLSIAQAAAQTDANVLLIGESGTGKEIFAQAIHNESARKDRPFIAVNCGAISKDLIQSELFGYAEGAFTGAKKGGKPGIFEAANGGTVFLDEIGEMPLDLQVNLLRVLQEREVVRVGDFRRIPIDVRIIAATNKNIEDEIAYKGTFRSDLYYRLNVFQINLIPLRERNRDIRELAEFFLADLNLKHQSMKSFSERTIEMLMSYHWPGNIRELRNIVERGFYLSNLDSVIDIVHLASTMQQPLLSTSPAASLERRREEKPIVLDTGKTEKSLIIQCLNEHHFNLSKTAAKLGISRTTLYKKLNQYQIQIHRGAE